MLIKLSNSILKKIKGDRYQLDELIGSRYLLQLVFLRGIMLLRGFFSSIKNGGYLFIGSGVSIKARSKIILGKGVTLNDGCLIDALSVEGVKMGNNSSLGKRSVIECSGSLQDLGKGIIVGDNVGLGRDCFYGCAGGIVIGSNTIIGNFVSFHSENHNYELLDIPIRLQGVNRKGIIIGENCWIGAKATILDGVTIEDGCIIAAGALVIAGRYEKNGIYGGVPAKLIKKRN